MGRVQLVGQSLRFYVIARPVKGGELMPVSLDPEARDQLDRFSDGLKGLDGFFRDQVAGRVQYWSQVGFVEPEIKLKRLHLNKQQLMKILIYAAVFLFGFVVGHYFHSWTGIPEVPIHVPHVPYIPDFQQGGAF
jgi:hypothetical protein